MTLSGSDTHEAMGDPAVQPRELERDNPVYRALPKRLIYPQKRSNVAGSGPAAAAVGFSSDHQLVMDKASPWGNGRVSKFTHSVHGVRSDSRVSWRMHLSGSASIFGHTNDDSALDAPAANIYIWKLYKHKNFGDTSGKACSSTYKRWVKFYYYIRSDESSRMHRSSSHCSAVGYHRRLRWNGRHIEYSY